MDEKHLSEVPLFASLSKRELQDVARHADEVDLGPGKELVHEGDFAFEVFAIEDGHRGGAPRRRARRRPRSRRLLRRDWGDVGRAAQRFGGRHLADDGDRDDGTRLPAPRERHAERGRADQGRVRRALEGAAPVAGLREVQQPLKQRYREDPAASRITLSARGAQTDAPVSCSIDLGRALYEAEAHAGVGGPGTGACSGDLLLGALAACAQLTCQMVATSMGIEAERIETVVDGDLDLSGTLGVSREAPVGFDSIRIRFEIDAPDASPDEIETLVRKTERYCVVLQTLDHAAAHRERDRLLLDWNLDAARLRRAAVLRSMSLANCSDTPMRTAPSGALADAAARSPQRAFVSASMRPFLLAALLDEHPDRPALVVAGDDRQARDLAADLKAFLAPAARPPHARRAACSYESHLAPPPHLVGLRVAAIDALTSDDRRGRRAGRGGQRPRRWRRRCPTRSCARTASRSPRATCSTSRRPPRSSWRAATSASTRSRSARSSRCAATSSTSTRPPRSAPCAASCSTSRSSGSRCFSTFTQRSLEEAERIEIAPAAEIGPEHRELAEMAATEEERQRPDIAEVLPVDRFRDVLSLLPENASVAIAAEEEVEPSLGDYWEDVDHELPRRGRAPPLPLARRAPRRRSTRASRCGCRASRRTRSTSSARRAPTAQRALASRRPSPSSRSSCAPATATVVAWARRGEAERAAYNLARVRASFLDGRAGAARGRRHVRRRQPARRASSRPS